MSWTLDVGQQQLDVVDARQLRQQLLQLHERAKRKPMIVWLNAPDGGCLTIGLGHEQSMLNYIAPGGWPARHTVGDETKDGLLEYECAGQVSEIPESGAIPLEEALDAALHFFNTGELAGHLHWEDD